MNTDKRVGLIGGGAMGRALVQGLLARGLPPKQLAVADPVAASRDAIAELGVASHEDNGAVVSESDVVVLAVKPQVLPAVLAGLEPLGETTLREPLWVSIEICSKSKLPFTSFDSRQ